MLSVTVKLGSFIPLVHVVKSLAARHQSHASVSKVLVTTVLGCINVGEVKQLNMMFGVNKIQIFFFWFNTKVLSIDPVKMTKLKPKPTS